MLAIVKLLFRTYGLAKFYWICPVKLYFAGAVPLLFSEFNFHHDQ